MYIDARSLCLQIHVTVDKHHPDMHTCTITDTIYYVPLLSLCNSILDKLATIRKVGILGKDNLYSVFLLSVHR